MSDAVSHLFDLTVRFSIGTHQNIGNMLFYNLNMVDLVQVFTKVSGYFSRLCLRWIFEFVSGVDALS